MQRTAADIQNEWLVLRCQSGDETALPLLVSLWHTRLYRHARRLVDHAHAADDVVQDSWLAIVRGLGRLDDPARFGPWAYRIVTNKCSDWTRRQVRDRAHGLHNDGAANTLAAGVNGDAIGDAADQDDELRVLRRAMLELSPDHRAALALHYLDGLSIAEIAMAMGVPPGTVKSRLHHARERLRATIERNERIES